MNCLRSCAGSAGFTTSTPGGPPKSAMWVKSRSGSNGKVFESAGAMQCVATPETTSVYPSGAAFATSSEPMTPPAPARFSTMKFSFKLGETLKENFIAARAGAVLDDEILLQGLAQLLRYQAAQSVGGSARCERNDDAHGLGGPTLREGTRAPEQQGDEHRGTRIEVACELRKGCIHRRHFT